jgi:hypothetical protein
MTLQNLLVRLATEWQLNGIRNGMKPAAPPSKHC